MHIKYEQPLVRLNGLIIRIFFKIIELFLKGLIRHIYCKEKQPPSHTKGPHLKGFKVTKSLPNNLSLKMLKAPKTFLVQSPTHNMSNPPQFIKVR